MGRQAAGSQQTDRQAAQANRKSLIMQAGKPTHLRTCSPAAPPQLPEAAVRNDNSDYHNALQQHSIKALPAERQAQRSSAHCTLETA